MSDSVMVFGVISVSKITESSNLNLSPSIPRMKSDEGLIGSFQFNRPQRANGVATLVVDGFLHYEHGAFHVT